MVAGLQSQQVGGCVKHFAANNQETDRMRISADADERTLREIYFPAFEHVVTTARPWLVMCSYNKVNGVYASQHRWLLSDVLRGEWGFDGLVVSDWGAVHDRVAALCAGLDLEMPPRLGVSDRATSGAVAAGDLDEAVLDQAAGRVLRLVLRSRDREPAGLDAAAHHALARRAAAQSMVLLKNDGVLPLAGGSGWTIAVIGELAGMPRFQGAGSSQVSPSGKLAETIPLRLADCPAYLNFPGEEGHVRYGEGVFAGYRSGELLAIIGSMPLATLAAFPGLGVTQELIGTLVAVVPGQPPGS